MGTIKRISLWASRILLQAELLIWVSVTPLVLLFGTAAPLKQALDKSDIYERLPDVILQQSVAVASNGQVPLGDAVIQKLIKDMFPEQKLKGYGDTFLDGMYRWLYGKAPEPDFKIDLSAERQAIAEGIANRAADRLAGLSPCTQLPMSSLDPFTIDCLPPGIDIGREKERLKNEVLASDNFLPVTVITADQLPKSSDGETFAEHNKELPAKFQVLKKLPWVFAGLGLATAAAMVWLSTNKRRGIRTAGRMILANGSFVLVTTLIFSLALPSLSESLRPRFVSGDAAPLMNDLIVALVQAINKALLISSGALVAIGGSILLSERFIKPNQLPKR